MRGAAGARLAGHRPARRRVRPLGRPSRRIGGLTGRLMRRLAEPESRNEADLALLPALRRRLLRQAHRARPRRRPRAPRRALRLLRGQALLNRRARSPNRKDRKGARVAREEERRLPVPVPENRIGNGNGRGNGNGVENSSFSCAPCALAVSGAGSSVHSLTRRRWRSRGDGVAIGYCPEKHAWQYASGPGASPRAPPLDRPHRRDQPLEREVAERVGGRRSARSPSTEWLDGDELARASACRCRSSRATAWAGSRCAGAPRARRRRAPS